MAERLPDVEELRGARLVADALLVGDEALPAGALLVVDELLVADEPFLEDELPVLAARALLDALERAALQGEPPGPNGSPGSEPARDAAQ